MVVIDLRAHSGYEHDEQVAEEIARKAVYVMYNRDLWPKARIKYELRYGYIFEYVFEAEMTKTYYPWKNHAGAGGVFLRKFIYTKRYTPPCPFSALLKISGAKELRLKNAIEKLEAMQYYDWPFGMKKILNADGSLYYIYNVYVDFIVFVYVVDLNTYMIFGIPFYRLDEKYKAFVLWPLLALRKKHLALTRGIYEHFIDTLNKYAREPMDGLITFRDWLREDYSRFLLDKISSEGE